MMLLSNACNDCVQYFHPFFSKVMVMLRVLFWINILTCWHSLVQCSLHPLARWPFASTPYITHRYMSCTHAAFQLWQKKLLMASGQRNLNIPFIACSAKNVSVISASTIYTLPPIPRYSCPYCQCQVAEDELMDHCLTTDWKGEQW